MSNIDKVIKLMKKDCEKYSSPIVTEISDITKSPFKVLVSCILSLRTKDKVTALASKRLLERADTPEKILKLSTKEIEKLIYPVGFYRRKAKNLKEISKDLIYKYGSIVPDREDELLKLKGVGRKTMGIVMCYGYGKNNYIPVDSHVHQVANRLGWVKTRNPEDTEIGLMKKIPKSYWHDLNDLFVKFGQNVCVPVSPFCSKCVVNKYCRKCGVKRHR